MKKHIYTEAEKTEITRLYPHCSTKEIARLFGISAASFTTLPTVWTQEVSGVFEKTAE